MRAKGAKEEKTMDGKRFWKRALAVAAATVTTVSALSLGMGGTTNAATFPLGDVNLDGKVNLKDAQLALKGALCIIKLDDMQFKAADVNKDNKVNLKDAQKILKGALMIEKIEGEISDAPTTTPPIATEKPIEPTETAVPTTAPTIQPTEVVKTTLEDGTVVITTPDEGIEGIDWEWRTVTDYWSHCYCGKLLDLDEHGYPVTNPTIGNAFTEHIVEFLLANESLSIEEMKEKDKCSGYVTEYATLSYKVKLK